MTEQPNEVTPEMEQEEILDSGQEEQPNEFETKYKELQAEFTRKSQELAELKKAKEKEDLPEDEKQLDERLSQRGYVKQDALVSQTEQLKLENWFSNLLNENPDLKKFEDAIRTIQKAEGGSFEEVVVRHWFSTEDKLAKAKSSRDTMVGTDTKKPKPQKSLTDMTPEEYEKRKKENGVWYSAGLVGSGSI